MPKKRKQQKKQKPMHIQLKDKLENGQELTRNLVLTPPYTREEIAAAMANRLESENVQVTEVEEE